jgi:hypothetical protein
LGYGHGFDAREGGGAVYFEPVVDDVGDGLNIDPHTIILFGFHCNEFKSL